MITYTGLPAPVMCDYLSREASRERCAPGTKFQIDKIEMAGNTRTYIDSPFHRYANGKDSVGRGETLSAQLRECRRVDTLLAGSIAAVCVPSA